MPAYDSNHFDPPAPLARVSLRSQHNGNFVSGVPMLIDSGSDLTLIPEISIDELNLDLDQNETYELTGLMVRGAWRSQCYSTGYFQVESSEDVSLWSTPKAAS